VLIVFVVLISVLYSLPNLYPDEPAIQVTGANASVTTDQAVLDSAVAALKAAGIPFHGAELQAKGALLRLDTADSQLKAKDVVSRALNPATSADDRFVIALNLAPTTPAWLRAIHASPMKLGLDLRGGVRFLMEVDMAKALEQRQDTYISDIKAKLREKKLAYRGVSPTRDGGFELKFETADDRQKGADLIKSEFKDFAQAESGHDGGIFLELTLTPEKLREITSYAVDQNMTTVRNRVNELGVAESVVQRQGANRIVIELPGIQDTAQAKQILGRTASLEFRFTDFEHSAADVSNGVAPVGSELLPFKDNKRAPQLLQKAKIVTGDRVVGARSSFDENGMPDVEITLDSRGGKLMADATRSNVGKSMAVVFIESKQKTTYVTGPDGKTLEVRTPYTEKNVINVATVQSMLGSQFRITGLDSQGEAQELALLLRAGALAAPMYYVEERTVGPSLGAENIKKGLLSTEIGFALVALFMLAFYRVFGIVANIALVINVAIVVAAMAAIGSALSLPGIAGIVLTVGIAVDANVLIYERIREELRHGMSPIAAIVAGYDRAFTTIIDSHVTTLIVAVILFAVGAGPVKGFAATLFIGILSSLFTSITVTRAVVNLIYGRGKRVTKLSI
jgi:preprotein translocase subunit SecD